MIVVAGEFDRQDVAKLLIFSEMRNTLCYVLPWRVRASACPMLIVTNAHLKS